jgi:hypothetical protein
MGKVIVDQSAPGHPGALADEEIRQLLGDGALGAAYDPSARAGDYTGALGATSLDAGRGDAGVLVIAILFLADRVSGGALSKLGEDIYSFAKQRLPEAMRRKRAATEEADGAYPFRAPEWKIQAEVVDEEQTGFSASLSASTPEGMVKAAQLLAETLERDAEHWDLGERRYVWRGEQQEGKVRVSRLVYEFDDDGHPIPDPDRVTADVSFE